MKSAIVALFSVFNTLGRIGFGYLSDRFQGRVSRTFWAPFYQAAMPWLCLPIVADGYHNLFHFLGTVWLGVAVLLMGLSSLFFAFVPATWMYFGIVFVGLACMVTPPSDCRLSSDECLSRGD